MEITRKEYTKGRFITFKRCQTITTTVTHALSNGQVEAALCGTAGQFEQLSSLFHTWARSFCFVPFLSAHFFLFAFCFWLSVLSHRSENGRKAAKQHKKRRQEQQDSRSCRDRHRWKCHRLSAFLGNYQRYCWVQASKTVLLKLDPYGYFSLLSRLMSLKGQRITRLGGSWVNPAVLWQSNIMKQKN